MDLLRDLRLACRSLARRPGFTLVAVLTLALGLGVNAALFSVADSLLLEPLPYEEPDELVMLRTRLSVSPMVPMSPLHLETLEERSRTLESVAAMDLLSFHLRGADGAERIDGALASPGFFDIFGTRALRGRLFDAAEHEPGLGERPVVLSHGFWQERFGGDESVLGRRLEMAWNAGFGPDRRLGAAFVVVGVLPPDFLPPQGEPDVWAPLALDAEQAAMPYPYLFPFGRLADDASPEAVREELSALVREAGAEGLDQRDPELGVTVVPLVERGTGELRSGLRVLGVAVVFVLLVACANVAMLLVARAAERRDELATRAALGASRLRLMRDLLAECLLLGLAGGALGLVLARFGVEGLRRLRPAALPRIENLALDGSALVFAVVLAVVASLLAGLWPAWRSARIADGRTARGTSPFRGGLVAVEVALAVTLAVGAGLLWRSFAHLQDTDLGVDPGVLSFQLSLPVHAYPDAADRAAFHRRVAESLAALPGVEGVAAINTLPLTLLNTATALEIEGLPAEDGEPRSAAYRDVLAPPRGAEDYFRTLGIPLRHGRLLQRGDEMAAVVNESFVRAVSEADARDLLGRRMDLLSLGRDGVEIVGIVADVRQAGPIRDVRPTVYLPGLDAASVGFVVGSPRDPASLGPEIRRAVAAVDPAQPVHALRTFGEMAAPWIARPRFHAALMGLFAALGLVLAALGVYGVLAQAVARRRREIGVRVALGAAPRRLLAWVLGEGLRPVAIGLVAGLAASLYLGRFLEGLLFGVEPNDPLTLAATALVLLLVAGVATLIPARRSLRVEPAEALREE